MVKAADRPVDRAHPAAGQPTFSAGAVRRLLGAFERLGHDVASLVRAAGLTPADLEDPDARIPYAAAGALFGVAQQPQPLANLGLRLAQETSLGAYPLVDYLIVTSATVVLVDIPGGDSEYSLSLTLLHLRRETAGAMRGELVGDLFGWLCVAGCALLALLRPAAPSA